ncbi:PorT family protein [Pontibacter sp. E15-1]|uniref:porin family protein n=1 Tax=Pontibacter sp. E15-1 TaxID=2919918 RepID=UPI001F4FB968|nr:porin family protein [Pontibacter sp. E15-1]MCJ8163720.1 PorT family protein [Pontibacter sp. E15-1]
MKTILLSALCLISLGAAAQSGFKNGYYTTQAGDTVQVQIQDENWIRNPNEISIMQQGKTRTLTQAEIAGFGLAQGDVYRKFTVDVDASPLSLSNMAVNQPAVILRDTVLLRLLVSGPANLYELNDKGGKRHFYIQKGNEEPKELMYRKVKKEVDGKRMVATQELYKGLLLVYLSDCGVTERSVHSTSFKAEALTKIINKYNSCVEPNQEEYVAKEEKTRLRFGVTAGLGVATYTAHNEGDYNELVGSNFSSMNPNAGLIIDMVLPRGYGRWGVSSELAYKTYKMSGDYSEKSSSSSYLDYKTTFDLQYAALNMQVVYTMKGDSKLRPFLSAGLAMNFLVGDKSNQTSTRSQYGIVREYENPPLEEMRKLEQAILLGAGINYSQFVVSARYERGNGFSPYIGLNVIKSASTVQLSYLFN